MEAHALAGTTLGAYRIEGLTGRGGMGDVFLAHDTRLDRPVALKVLAEPLAEDDRFRERLLRESRLAASLDHPNVVPIYDAGEADGRLFIAMRYVQGLDLKRLLRTDGKLEGERAVAIAAQVADALDAAHRRGLVHRDVKPSNVLLDRQDEREHAYLADFGLMQSGRDSGPADGQFMGTVDYVAPEQIRGEDLDGRADQYALGCLLFECLTGTLPFRCGSDVAAIYAHLEEAPPLASERCEDLPPAVDSVLQRAMAKEPAERFRTCGELVDEAHEALGLGGLTPSRRWLVRALTLVLVALSAAVVIVASRTGHKAAAGAPTGTLTRIDPRTNRVARSDQVPGYPNAVQVTSGGVWIADFRQGVLWRYDPATGGKQRISSTGEPRDLARLGPYVYVASDGNDFTGFVTRYDASTGVRADSVGLLACAMASGEGVVWAAGCPYVDRLSTDSRRLRIVRRKYLPYPPPTTTTASTSRVQFRDMAVGAGSLWVLGDALDRRVWRLDPRSGHIEKTIALPFPPRSAVVAAGALWITDPLHDTVVPVDVRTNRVLAPVAVGRGASGVAAGSGGVWVASAIAGTVSRIDPRTRRIVATVPVGGFPSEIATGRGTIWVTSHEP